MKNPGNLSRKELVEACIEIVEAYSEDVDPESYIQTQLNCIDGSEEQKQFILEIFSGLRQFSTLIQVTADAVYQRYDILNSKRARLMFIAYLIVVEFGSTEILELLFAASPRLSKQVLLYITNSGDLNYLIEAWYHIYDREFTDRHFGHPLKKNREQLIDLIDQLDQLGAKVGKFKKIDPTVPKAFVFQETRDRTVQDFVFEDEEPSLTHEVPRTTYIKPRNLTSQAQMHREHEKNARVARLLEESENTAFRCATNEKSVKTILKMEQIKLEESRKNEPHKVRRRPVPKQKTAPVIRQTAAGLLRESAMYAKREEKSAKELEQLMSGARDLTEYSEWQDQVNQQKKQAEEDRKAENLLRAKITREEAILSKQREIDLNHAKTEELKAEMADLQRRKGIADAKELIKIKKRIAEIAEADRCANEAREQLQKDKSKLVKSQQAEFEAIKKKKERRDQKEMEKRRAVIKEIRQLEAELIENRANQKTQIDMTETGGYNLLGEMSLLELRERLSMTKEKHKAEEERRRNQINEDKKKFDLRLQMAAEKVQAHRAQKQKSIAVQSSVKPKTPENSKLAEMKKMLELKQQERIRVQSENGSRPSTRRSTPSVLSN